MTELEELNERLENLEKRTRRARLFTLSVLLAGGALLIVGQAAPKGAKPDGKRVIEADEFVVRDERGNVRVRIYANGGNAGIALVGGEGKSSVSLVATQEMGWSGLTAYSEDAGFEATASVLAKRNDSEIAVKRTPSEFAKKKRDAIRDGTFAELYFKKGGELLVGDEVSLFVRNNSMGVTAEHDGKERFHWMVSPESTEIVLMDKDSKVRGLWDVEDGEPALTLMDSAGKSRLILGVIGLKDMKYGTKIRRSESSIMLFGEDDKIAFSAP